MNTSVPTQMPRVPLIGKKIAIGISGGIAAYKAPLLIRALKKAGAEVRVIASANAMQFVTKWTLETLAETALESELFPDSPGSTHHIDTAQWADLFVVAPATANVIGKLASGVSDDILTTTLCAYSGPVMIAPAMNTNMYLNPITKKNLATLREVGFVIVDPDEGEMACHTVGVGRMAEPERIFATIESFFNAAKSIIPPIKGALAGRRVVVTAGPCREMIDPVRYISNRSSGKMGYALAAAAKASGAEVTLITGPVAIAAPPGVRVIHVESTVEMRDATLAAISDADILIMAAAPADYMPEAPSPQKIKKNTAPTALTLVPTPDILREVAAHKSPRLLVVGFALESENLIENGRAKLRDKDLDLVVINSATASDSGPAVDTNAVIVITREGAISQLPMMPKTELATEIVTRTATLLSVRQSVNR